MLLNHKIGERCLVQLRVRMLLSPRASLCARAKTKLTQRFSQRVALLQVYVEL